MFCPVNLPRGSAVQYKEVFMVRLMLVLGLVLSLAACSGGDRIDGLSKAEEAALQDRVDVAEAARIKAEAEKATAEREKAEADRQKTIAEEEQERQRQAAETARLEAEAAKRAKERLEDEAEEARKQLLQAEAIDALAGLGMPPSPALVPTVTAQYRAPALVSPPSGLNPSATFTSPTGSSAGRWWSTTAQSRGQMAEDTIVVYSDVDAHKATAITQVYRNRFTPVDNVLEATIQAADSDLVASTSHLFPTGGGTDTVDLTEEPDANDDNTQTGLITGTFDGAPGFYRCVGSSPGVPCSVRHTGRGYVLDDGTWTFRTRSANATVNVDDKDFMYFGWWRRETNTGQFSYGVFGEPEPNTNTVAGNNDFTTLTGSADYVGPAIGQYAIPFGTESNHGEFKATARFTANFDTDKLSGTVRGFDVNPGWSLTLKETDMPTGTVATGRVSWTIDGNTLDGGTWDGKFQSEINPYAGHIPDGLTGTFEAIYGTIGRLQGAYGTHTQ